MKEIEIRDDIWVTYEEVHDGEAILIAQETEYETTDSILLLRPIAIQLAKIILEMMGDDEGA